MRVLALFPGQGSQKVGMLSPFLNSCSSLIKKADDILNFPLSRLIQDGPQETLNLTKWAQPAIMLTSICAWTRVQRETVSVLLGHSLGELTALQVAGVLSFEDAILLAFKRGILMQEAVPEGIGGMLAVISDKIELIQLLSEEAGVWVANFNSPNQVVVSGTIKNLEKFKTIAQQKLESAKLIPLKVSAPFHCPLLKSAREAFLEELKKVTLKTPTIPVISNYLASVYPSNPADIAYALASQIDNPVRFVDCLKFAKDNFQADTILEVGHGEILTKLALATFPYLKKLQLSE